MKRYIFTFGFGQFYPNGYVVIYGDSRDDCRNKMFARYGKAWSMQYPSEEAAGVAKWGMQLIDTIDAPSTVESAL